jgi:hypothetical protein
VVGDYEYERAHRCRTLRYWCGEIRYRAPGSEAVRKAGNHPCTQRRRTKDFAPKVAASGWQWLGAYCNWLGSRVSIENRSRPCNCRCNG